MVFIILARRVFPAVQPGYMKPMLPDEAPQEGEPFQDIFEDFQRIVLPGVFIDRNTIIHVDAQN
jgi:hypothetical protein